MNGTRKKKELKRILTGLAFLSPNILGFLAFIIIPLFFSMALAFSNWDLRYHNMFQNDPIRFVGLKNFIQLFHEKDFWRFLGNTFFLMIGMPVAIAGSLMSAILLSKDLKGRRRGTYRLLLPASLFFASSCVLVLCGLGASTFCILLGSTAGLMLIGGVMFGQAVYRTLFYLPHFTSGVAVFILWKKMYSPYTGPINAFIAGPLTTLSAVINNVIPSWGCELGMWMMLAVMTLTLWMGLRYFLRLWNEGDFGHGSLVVAAFFSVIPFHFAAVWLPTESTRIAVVSAALVILALAVAKFAKGREFSCPAWNGVGSAILFSAALLGLEFIMTGLAKVLFSLPLMASKEGGIQPPDWLASYHWAKPAIMIMGLWGAIGSNNMLLYLAGLSNISPELEEAAEIDGAGGFQKFWHITWPQLAPITFFIVVMSVIGGLQGGFEMARTMTQGGPAGTTTTLSYFIYNEGFVTGRLGYSSAIAWFLFIMILTITLFNWRFGSKYVND